LYMSPEAIQSPLTVDGRSDLYGLGAVGYFLLTGKPVFEATNIIELCRCHVEDSPQPLSELIEGQISSELENAILSCLEKSRAKRPQTARDFATMLAACPEMEVWKNENAEVWWRNHFRGKHDSHQPEPTTKATQKTEVSGLDRTIVHDA